MSESHAKTDPEVAAAVDETVAAFEPDRRRDDRAIVVIRVSD